MRRSLLFAILTAAVLAAIPSESEAFGRRGRAVWCPPACPAPPVYYPGVCYPPGTVIYLPGPVVYGPLTFGPAVVEAPEEVTIKGKRYRILPDLDPIDYREDVVDREAETIPFAAAANIPVADRFSGTSRRLAKTTISPAVIAAIRQIWTMIAV